MEQKRNAYKILIGKPEGKRPLRRPRRRWESNITFNVKQTGPDNVNWIHLAQDRDQLLVLVYTVKDFQVP
jgi:hypothetical protein